MNKITQDDDNEDVPAIAAFRSSLDAMAESISRVQRSVAALGAFAEASRLSTSTLVLRDLTPPFVTSELLKAIAQPSPFRGLDLLREGTIPNFIEALETVRSEALKGLSFDTTQITYVQQFLERLSEPSTIQAIEDEIAEIDDEIDITFSNPDAPEVLLAHVVTAIWQTLGPMAEPMIRVVIVIAFLMIVEGLSFEPASKELLKHLVITKTLERSDRQVSRSANEDQDLS